LILILILILILMPLFSSAFDLDAPQRLPPWWGGRHNPITHDLLEQLHALTAQPLVESYHSWFRQDGMPPNGKLPSERTGRH
jgi:hypothetical protein